MVKLMLLYLLITSELTNQSARKALFTCVVYTKVQYLLPVCQILRNFTERNTRTFTVRFAFCVDVDVMKY